MRNDRFEELCDAIRMAKAVSRGEAAPSRVWEVARTSDGKIVRRQLDPEAYRKQRAADLSPDAVRKRLGLSQGKFPSLLGISVKTLHNWEQGRRKPTGAARVLLRVASLHPQAVLDAAA